MALEESTLYLVEHFFSIQGEGRYCGVPSVFLRFGGCNLRCPGFGCREVDGKMVYGCDTIRAVYGGLYRKSWHPVTKVQQIESIVTEYESSVAYRPDIVITGGEPMIYASNPVFNSMLEKFVDAGYRVTIETNATIAPSFSEHPFYGRVTFAMAVKLSGSGEPKNRRLVPEAIEALALKGRDSFFKFTLDAALTKKGGSEEIAEICDGYGNEVYCMPLGGDERELSANAAAVAEFCLKNGYRYSDRLHVRLWNREERR